MGEIYISGRKHPNGTLCSFSTVVVPVDPDSKPCPPLLNHALMGILGIIPCGPNCRYDRDRQTYLRALQDVADGKVKIIGEL